MKRPLSPREKQVVDLWASGQTHKSIGLELGISINTVNEHLRRARIKYEIKTAHAFLCKLIVERMMAELAQEVTAEVVKAVSDAGVRMPSLWMQIRA